MFKYLQQVSYFFLNCCECVQEVHTLLFRIYNNDLTSLQNWLLLIYLFDSGDGGIKEADQNGL